MTYSINTLKGSGRDGSPPSSQFRFAQEISLFVTALVLLFWLTALLTYSVTDSAWSTSGVGDHIHNWMGRVGAWLADLTYFLTGFSAWWLVLGCLESLAYQRLALDATTD